MKDIIYLQKIGGIEKSILLTLKKRLKKVFKGFHIKFKVYRGVLLLTEAEYHPEKKQYESEPILNKIVSHLKEKHYFRGLGIMKEDVYSEDKNFVFGSAYKPRSNKRVAFVSIMRLSEEFYSRPENRELINNRLLKEAIHELGHTFGLNHCENRCVMRFSKDLAEANKKPAEYCDKCSNILNTYLNQ